MLTTMKHILITGNPGVGKTTLVKKLIDAIKSKDLEHDGFFTEEIRSNNYRIGFDAVLVNGKRAVLARKSATSNINMSMVGQYVVHPEEFENLVMPIFNQPKKFMIIDEIGKMEMFSFKFQEHIKKLFKDKNVTVIATVPLQGGPFWLKHLKESKECELITVDQSNREDMLNDIIKLLQLKC